MDREDVRVIERRGSLGFLREPPEPIGIRGEVGWKDLDRDFAARARYRARDTPRPSRPRRAARESRNFQVAFLVRAASCRSIWELPRWNHPAGSRRMRYRSCRLEPRAGTLMNSSCRTPPLASITRCDATFSGVVVISTYRKCSFATAGRISATRGSRSLAVASTARPCSRCAQGTSVAAPRSPAASGRRCRRRIRRPTSTGGSPAASALSSRRQ